MKINFTTIAGVIVLWLGTLFAAFHFGNNREPAADANPTTGSSATARATPAPPNRSGAAARKAPDRETVAKPLTVKQLLAKMKAAMRGGAMQNPSSMMKVMGLMDKIRPEDVQAALAEAEATTDPQQKMLFTMCLLSKWAETDGAAAMKYAEEHSTGQGPLGQIAKMSVAGAWAEKDPEAVWKWYKSQSDKDNGGMFGRNMVVASLFSSMADNNLDTAFKRLQEIDGSAKQMALAGMFQTTLFDDSKRQQILKYVDLIADDSERKQAKQAMLSTWTMTSPEQAIEWVKTQPQDEQRDYRQSVGMMLMMNDPKKGAGYVVESATDEEKPQAYSQVVSQWAHMDATAAGTWLQEQPQGPQLDEARQAMAKTVSQKDPENAMSWAAAITKPELKVSATTTVYQAWAKKDPAAAGQALEKSGLDRTQIQTVKAAASPPDNTLPGPPR